MLNSQEIQEIRQAYQAFEEVNSQDFSAIRGFYKNFMLKNHPDKNPNAPESLKNKVKIITAAFTLLDSLHKEPARLRAYQQATNTSLGFISANPTVLADIYLKTHSGDSAYQISEVYFSELEHCLQRMANAIDALGNQPSQTQPQVLTEAVSAAHIVNANNYTLQELAHLHTRITHGSYRLPYPLRYASLEDVSDAHRFLVHAINLEHANQDCLQAGVDELALKSYVNEVSAYLETGLSLSYITGCITIIVTDYLPLVMVQPVTIVGLSLMLAIPMALYAAMTLHERYYLSQYNSVVNHSLPLMREFFFKSTYLSDELLSINTVNGLCETLEELANTTEPQATTADINPVKLGFFEQLDDSWHSLWQTSKPQDLETGQSVKIAGYLTMGGATGG